MTCPQVMPTEIIIARLVAHSMAHSKVGGQKCVNGGKGRLVGKKYDDAYM